MERLDHRGGVELLALAQDLAQVGERLLGAAQDPVLAGEDLHADHRVEPFGGEDASRPLEVDVGGVAGQDIGRGLKSRRVDRLSGRGLVGGHGAAV